MTTQVRTLEDGQYRRFNILKEIQEWWEAQAIMAVIGQETNVDSEEVELMKAWEPSEAYAGDCNGSHKHSVCHVHILSTLPNRENHPLK